MKKALIAFLTLGFLFGFAATTAKNVPISTKKRSVKIIGSQPPTQKLRPQQKSIENFDFLYGQWELLSAQELKSRAPASLDDKSLNFVLEDDIYLDSNAAVANGACDSGVEFKKYSKGEHQTFIKQAKKLPLMKSYFGDGRRAGIWTGEVLCKGSNKVLWSAALLTRRQLFLTSGTHVVELYRRDNVAPIRETFTDSDAEVSTE